MATLAAGNLTLLDWSRRIDPQGKVPAIAEVLNETNEVLDDMVFKEGNLPTGHKSIIRTGLPDVVCRLLNYGVPISKSTTQAVTDTCGMIEGYSEVDKDIADLNGETSSFRLSEDRAFIASMSKTHANLVFNGDTRTNPEKIMGFGPRFSLKSADNGANIIDGGSNDTDNTSIWLVVWGDETCFGMFPKGKQAGLQHKDLGEVTLTDAAGGHFQGYRAHYKWDTGLVVKDWRYIVRIANIEVSDLLKDASTGADIRDLMVQALEAVPSLSSGKPVFYCNKTIRSFLRRQLINKANVNLTFDTAGGKRVLAFDEVPVKRCDAITNTETLVS